MRRYIGPDSACNIRERFMYESSIRDQLIESATITIKILFFIFYFFILIYLFIFIVINN